MDQEKPHIKDELTFKQCLKYIQHEEDGNDDICFNCRLNGQLFCCDNCFRAFHKTCLDKAKVKEIQNINTLAHFICQYCQTPKKCQKCKININPQLLQDPSQNSHDSNHTSFMSLNSKNQNQFFICTSCYQFVHKKCEDISLVTLYHKYTQIDTNQLQVLKHYICKNCLYINGVQNLLTSKKIINKMFDQKLYHLVRLYSLSPIQYGWFQESIMSYYLQDLIARQESRLQNISQDSPQSLANSKIQKIIQMKIPIRLNQFPLFQILECVTTKNQNFNSRNFGFHQNLQYLVKWEGKDYSNLSWQDQTVVFLFKQQITAFHSLMLYRSFVAQSILKNQAQFFKHFSKKSLNFILTLEHKLEESALSEKKCMFKQNSKGQRPILEQQSNIIKKMKQCQQSYQTQLIQFSKQYTSFNIKCLIQNLNNIYSVQFKMRPTVIVSNNMQRWQKSLRQLCHVNYIIFKGSKHNVDCIKERQFTIMTEPPLFKFQILLLNYQYFEYEKQFIFKSVPFFYSFIFDSIQSDQFLSNHYFSMNPVCQKQLIMFSDDKNDKTTFLNALIKACDKQSTTLKKNIVHRDFNFAKVFKINTQINQSNETTHKVNEESIKRKLKIINQGDVQSKRLSNQILTEIQRIAFLKFILTWGLNFQTFQQAFQRLTGFCRGIFILNQGIKQEELKKKVQQYLTYFMSLLNSYKHHNVITDYENHYLFKSKSSDIYKRICQLSKLKKKVQQFKDAPNQFPYEKQFNYFAMKQVKVFPKWNASEDYTLAAMIIQKGFDRWLQIGQSRSWVKYHQQIQTRKVARYMPKTCQYEIREQQVIGQQKNSMDIQKSDQLSQNRQKKPVLKYFEYLQQKLKSAKDLDRKKPFQIQTLIQQRGHYLLKLMK